VDLQGFRYGKSAFQENYDNIAYQEFLIKEFIITFLKTR